MARRHRRLANLKIYMLCLYLKETFMLDRMKQLYDMQKKAKDLQRQLENTRVEKTSADGLIKVSVNGTQRVDSLSIDASLLTPEKKTALEQAVSRVINDAF